MELSSKKELGNLLKKHGVRPSKKLGQNFLLGREAVGKVLGGVSLELEDIVLEIGPGAGVLTRELAKKAKRVVAVEKDRKMAEVLKESLGEYGNAEVVFSDILKFSPGAFGLEDFNYKAVGNLPFYLTAPVIRKFLEGGIRPLQMILVVQKEVGERICASPPKMSILAVSVQVYAEAEVVDFLSKEAFWPSPEVDAAVIKITPKRAADLPDNFFGIVKAGFSQPRKQLANNLSAGLEMGKAEAERRLRENGIQPAQRAETLSVENWLKLSKSFKMDK